MNRVIVLDNYFPEFREIGSAKDLARKINDFAEQHKIINISAILQNDDLLYAFVLYEEQEEQQ